MLSFAAHCARALLCLKTRSRPKHRLLRTHHEKTKTQGCGRLGGPPTAEFTYYPKITAFTSMHRCVCVCVFDRQVDRMGGVI